MGIDNYQKIIKDNGNTNDIVISTIGYGMDIQNEIFNERIAEDYYNFIEDNKEIKETIEQGSRIGEILVDSTTDNIKLLPLVVVNEDGYTNLISIINAFEYAIKNSDVICYELMINDKNNEVIDLIIEKAFKENKPICAVTANEEKNYPANHGMTIAVSSIDRNFEIADYSGRGNFIDFAVPSTDIEEIFNLNSTVSRWSGPQYSNAQIVAVIALIKTYDKNATILDIYNFLRNFSTDIGEQGKDEEYGYGMPQFSRLTIADLDKQQPEFIDLTFDNETWEVLKQIKIKAKDNIRVHSWAITKNIEAPQNEEWKELEAITPDLDITAEITENGIYYVWVRDSAGNTIQKEIQIDKVDNEPPRIAYTIDKSTITSGFVTIKVTAEDQGCGLYDSPFSWDKTIWSKENSKKIVTENGRYIVYAEDNLGNISEKEILVDCFAQIGRSFLGEGNIIHSIQVSAEWEGNTNKNVQIRLNQDINLIGWQVSSSFNFPDTFISVNQNVVQDSNSSGINNTTNNVSINPNVVLPNNEISSNNTNNAVDANNTTNTNNTNEINQTNQVNQTNQTNQIITEPIENVTEPIVITRVCDIDTTYFVWVKDQYGNITCQTFTIAKAEI